MGPMFRDFLQKKTQNCGTSPYVLTCEYPPQEYIALSFPNSQLEILESNDKYKPYVHICALTDTYTATSKYLVILINIIAMASLFIYIGIGKTPELLKLR